MNTNETHPYASQVNRLLALLTQSGFALNSVYDGGETIPTLSIDAAASNILGVDESTLYVTHPERKSSLALYIVLGNGAGELVSDWTSWDKLNSLLDSYSEAEQMSREEVLEFIRSNDANGYETLEGDETLDQLLDAQLSIKASGPAAPAICDPMDFNEVVGADRINLTASDGRMNKHLDAVIRIPSESNEGFFECAYLSMDELEVFIGHASTLLAQLRASAKAE